MAPAGASPPPADPQRTATANGSATTGLVAPEPGLYRCEGNRRVLIRRIYDNGRSIVLNWSGQDHILQAPADAPGPRQWQDDRAGLAWLAADGRATLLDLRQGQRLASDCRL